MTQDLNANDRLDIVDERDLHIVVDDVSDGRRAEYRASVYEGGELVGEGWGATRLAATLTAVEASHS